MEEVIGIITFGVLKGVDAFMKRAGKGKQKKINQKKIPQRKTFKDIAKQKLV